MHSHPWSPSFRGHGAHRRFLWWPAKRACRGASDACFGDRATAASMGRPHPPWTSAQPQDEVVPHDRRRIIVLNYTHALSVMLVFPTCERYVRPLCVPRASHVRPATAPGSLDEHGHTGDRRRRHVHGQAHAMDLRHYRPPSPEHASQCDRPCGDGLPPIHRRPGSGRRLVSSAQDGLLIAPPQCAGPRLRPR